MHKKDLKFELVAGRVSEAKFYLKVYHSTKIAKAGPGFDEIPQIFNAEIF